jgi:hypothetical protein
VPVTALLSSVALPDLPTEPYASRPIATHSVQSGECVTRECDKRGESTGRCARRGRPPSATTTGANGALADIYSATFSFESVTTFQ